jgi:hypothetical protein
VNWKVGLLIPVGLALTSAALPRLSAYLVKEAFVFLLGLAILFSAVLLIVIAVLLLWRGVSAVFFWIRVFRFSGATRYFG